MIGTFTDVEKLKTTTKELFKILEKQAEEIQADCDKVLTEQDSKDLHRIMKEKLSKYSVLSPTPSSFRRGFRGRSPHPASHRNQDKVMERDERIEGFSSTRAFSARWIRVSTGP